MELGNQEVGLLWVGGVLEGNGLETRSDRLPDAMQGAGFAIVLPLSFLAGTFVPIEGMDAVPRGEWDPISTLVAAFRHLTQGTSSHGSRLLEHPVAGMVLWCTLIIAICVPLALRRFRVVGG